MAKVIVLAGGNSDERAISLRSGAVVLKALEKDGHTVTMLDPAGGLSKQLPELQKADVVFPALHGAGGEDGTVQAFLEKHGIPYVGSDSQASIVCFDKARYAKLLMDNDILTPVTEMADYAHFQHSALSLRPFVLKPNDGGSSIDTFIVRDPGQLDDLAIQKAFGHHRGLLLQELIEGVEITVGMLEDVTLPVVEIIPPAGSEFDYENKYNGRTEELCPPKHVSPGLQVKAQVLAKQVHELTGCRDMSRTDIIVTPSDELYVLETNTIPGLTEESLLPKAAAVAGHEMPEFCGKLVESALERNT